MLNELTPDEGFLIPSSVGHTLLAVEAPQGTQLDVPIPKAVSIMPLKNTAVSS